MLSSLLMTIPPGLWLALGGLLLASPFKPLRYLLVLVLPLLLLAILWSFPEAHSVSAGFLGYQLIPLEISKLGRLFATVFLIMAWVGGLFALRYARRLELSAAFVYAGSALLVVLCGDLITLLIGWEL
ncbi:MAG: Na+/H+ antiporter subunit D, partial [Nevskiales bacterium]